MARTKSERVRATEYTECYPVNLMVKVLYSVEGVSVGDFSIADFLLEVHNLEGKRGDVLELRFKEGMTLEEAGKELGITRERARQLEALGIDNLSRKLASGSCRIIHQSEYEELYEKYTTLCEKYNALMSIIQPSGEGVTPGAVSKVVNYSESIDNLALSRRTINCLTRARIRTIADVIAYDKDDSKCWDDIRGFGVSCKRELQAQIQRCAGYALGW